MKVAVVPAGYADGLDRRGTALIRGARAPIVGAVSMDMLTLDVTVIDGVSTGDEVSSLGRQGPASWQTINAREMRAWIGTIPYWNVLRPRRTSLPLTRPTRAIGRPCPPGTGAADGLGRQAVAVGHGARRTPRASGRRAVTPSGAT